MLQHFLNHKKLPALLLLCYAVVGFLSIWHFEGTGDAGDSVHHFLFARDAFRHPELFFHHWAKPLFVLLASPFAQFGFAGMKVFNLLCTLLCIYLTYRSAVYLKVDRPILIMVFMMFSPLYYILTFSGLTEPLFALVLSWALLQALKKQTISAALIISFLPYVRSEGLIVAGVFLFYFILRRQWKAIPAILVGSLIYGLAGVFVHHSIFWVFTHIPYSTLSSVYGHGDLTHFVVQLINVVGVPLYVLFWWGAIHISFRFFRNRSHPEESILVLGTAMAFILAHSLFWYLGIFNSMGLKRVLIGILPVLALISLKGFNSLLSLLQTWPYWRKSIGTLLLLYILIFPFSNNPSAIHWQRDMELTPDQQLAKNMLADLTKKAYTGKLIYNYYYFSLLTGKDHFENPTLHRIGEGSIQAMQVGDILIWDSEFAEFESGYTREKLNSDTRLKNILNLSRSENGRNHHFAAYTQTTALKDSPK